MEPFKAPAIDVAAVVLESGVDASAGTFLPAWYGERMDMGMAVEGLLLAEERRDQ